jgi:hypothetical protein
MLEVVTDDTKDKEVKEEQPQEKSVFQKELEEEINQARTQIYKNNEILCEALKALTNEEKNHKSWIWLLDHMSYPVALSRLTLKQLDKVGISLETLRQAIEAMKTPTTPNFDDPTTKEKSDN